MTAAPSCIESPMTPARQSLAAARCSALERCFYRKAQLVSKRTHALRRIGENWQSRHGSKWAKERIKSDIINVKVARYLLARDYSPNTQGELTPARPASSNPSNQTT